MPQKDHSIMIFQFFKKTQKNTKKHKKTQKNRKKVKKNTKKHKKNTPIY